MTSLFEDATNFNGDLSCWNVSKVTDMSNMFNTASAFNKDIRKWNVGENTHVPSMFYGATQMTNNYGSEPDGTILIDGSGTPLFFGVAQCGLLIGIKSKHLKQGQRLILS